MRASTASGSRDRRSRAPAPARRPHRALRRRPHLALEAPRRAVAVLLVVEGGRHEDVLLAEVVAVEPDVVAALAGRPGVRASVSTSSHTWRPAAAIAASTSAKAGSE